MDSLNSSDPSTWDTIRVVFARNPPDLFDNCPQFPTLDPSGVCPFPGWTAEVNKNIQHPEFQILKMVADALRLRIVPIVLNNEVGSLDWGTLRVWGRLGGQLLGQWKVERGSGLSAEQHGRYCISHVPDDRHQSRLL